MGSYLCAFHREAAIDQLLNQEENHNGPGCLLVMNGGEVIVTRNGKEVGRFIPREAVVSYLTDSLTGILSGDADIDQAREERLREKKK